MTYFLRLVRWWAVLAALVGVAIIAFAQGAGTTTAATDPLLLIRLDASQQDNQARILLYANPLPQFTTTVAGQKVQLAFAVPISIEDENVVQSALPKTVSSVLVSEDRKMLTFGLLDPNAQVKTIANDQYRGVEIVSKAEVTTPDKLVESIPTPPATEGAAAPAQVTKDPLLPANAPAAESVPVAAVQSDASASTAEKKAEVSPADASQKTDSAAPSAPPAAEVSTQETQAVNAKNAEEKSSLSSPVSPPSPPVVMAEKSAPEEVVQQGAEGEEASVKVAQAGKEQELLGTIKFPWNTDVAAAVFQRGNVLWVVFNQDGDFDLRMLRAQSGELVSKVERVPNRLYTILRFTLKEQAFAEARKDKTDWSVNLYSTPHDIIESIPITSKYSKLKGGSTLVSVKDAAKTLRLVDPEIGDELVIMPLFHQGVSVSTPYRHVDFNILSAAQGLVIQMVSDGVSMEMQKLGFEIVGPTHKLTYSAIAGGNEDDAKKLMEETAEAQAAARSQGGGNILISKDEGLFRFQSWLKTDKPQEFVATLQNLQNAIVQAKTNEISRKRLDLARFYLAHGLYAEAAGVIRVMESSLEKNEPPSYEMLAVRGAAEYLQGHSEDAIKTFSGIKLSLLPPLQQAEVNFWKAAAQVQQGRTLHLDKFLIPASARRETVDQQVGGQQKDSIEKLETAKLILETSSRLLKMIKKVDPDLANSEEVQTLEATANFVSSHYQEVIKTEDDVVENKPSQESQEATAQNMKERVQWWWQGGDTNDQVSAQFAFLRYKDAFLRYYPDHVFNDFAVLALDDRLRKNDLDSAEKIFDSMREDPRADFANTLAYYHGLFFAKDENEEKAIATWTELSKNPTDRRNRAMAEYALVNYQLQQKLLDKKEAIDRLNTIRLAWRGDVLELNLLRQIGELYMDQKEFMLGFKAWRELISSFPGSEEALTIARRMSEMFIAIFNRGEIPKDVSQLAALTFYYEFRELTPIGKNGDEMIQKLAERLVAVDLLDRAAALLTHQVRFRLSGEEKDRVSTRLAEIHLMSRKPKLALEVLRATEAPRIQEHPELATKRRQLKATALLELKRLDEVLALVASDTGVDAAFIRAGVYWEQKDWKNVVHTLEAPVRRIYREDRKVSDREANELIKLSVAYTLLGEQAKLKRLHSDFIDYIPNPEKRELFSFLTVVDSRVDPQNLQASLQLDQMERFMHSYFERKGK